MAAPAELGLRVDGFGNRRATLHDDSTGYIADSGRRDPLLPSREIPLGTAVSEFDADGKESGKVVFGADILGYQENNFGLVVLNSFPNPNKQLLGEYTWQQDAYDEATGRDNNPLRVITSGQQLETLRPQEIAVIHQIEGLRNYEGRIRDLLEHLYKRNIRLIAPVHNADNRFGTGCNTTEAFGLTKEGEELIRLGNEMGFIWDTTHASARAAEEIEALGQRVVMTHGASRNLLLADGKDQPRAAWDNVIVKMAQRGDTLVGVGLIAWLVAADASQANVSRVADHFVHYRNVLSQNGVSDPTNILAIGGHFNGCADTSAIPGMRSIDTAYDALGQELLTRDFTDEQVIKMLGRNAYTYFTRQLPR